MFMTYYKGMKVANIAEFKNKISEYLSAVEKGEEVEVRKRNTPIARVVPIRKTAANVTKLGCGKGTGRINADPTEPFIPEGDWEMLRKAGG
jgi:prevent-host-death family protein